MGIRLGEGAGVDAGIKIILARLGDIENLAEGGLEAACRHLGSRIVDVAAGDVDNRAGIEVDRAARIDRHRSACGGQFAHGVLHLIDVPQGVDQWGADPRRAVGIGAGAAQIDVDGLALQILLVGRIGQLRAQELHGDDVVGHGGGNVARTGHIDDGVATDVETAFGEVECVHAEHIRNTGLQGDLRIGCENFCPGIGTRCFKIDGLGLNQHLRRQREDGDGDGVALDDLAGNGFGAVVFGQNLGKAAGFEGDRAGVAVGEVSGGAIIDHGEIVEDGEQVDRAVGRD